MAQSATNGLPRWSHPLLKLLASQAAARKLVFVKEIVDWAEANDVELADYTMEKYINDPTTVAREDIETLILIPVIGSPVITEDRTK